MPRLQRALRRARIVIAADQVRSAADRERRIDEPLGDGAWIGRLCSGLNLGLAQTVAGATEAADVGRRPAVAGLDVARGGAVLCADAGQQGGASGLGRAGQRVAAGDGRVALGGFANSADVDLLALRIASRRGRRIALLARLDDVVAADDRDVLAHAVASGAVRRIALLVALFDHVAADRDDLAVLVAVIGRAGRIALLALVRLNHAVAPVNSYAGHRDGGAVGALAVGNGDGQ